MPIMFVCSLDPERPPCSFITRVKLLFVCMNVFMWNTEVPLQNKFKVTWFVFILIVGLEPLSASEGTAGPPQGLLGPLQGLPLHTLPVARNAALLRHLKGAEKRS